MNLQKWKALSLALALSGATAAVAQTPAAPATDTTSKPAEYDCSGMTGTPLATCLDLNAGRGGSGTGNSGYNGAGNTPGSGTAADTTTSGGSHDCSGLTGASLGTCQTLNRDSAAPSTSRPVANERARVNGRPANTDLNSSTSGNAASSGNSGNAASPGNSGSAATSNSSAGTNNGLSGGSGTGGSSAGTNNGLSGGSGTGGSSAGTNNGLSGGSGTGGASGGIGSPTTSPGNGK